MAILVDRDIELAVDLKLGRPAQGPSPGPASAPRRRPAPPVRFSPLIAEAPPEARRRRRILVGISIAFHVVLVVVVMVMPKQAQSIEEPNLPIEVMLTVPIPSAPEMTMPRPKPVPAPQPRPEPKREPRDETPPPVAEAPKPLPKPSAPEPAPVAKIEPPRPRPEIKTGLLEELSSGPAIATSRASRSAFVAGGFDGEVGASSSPARPGRVMAAAFDDAPTATRPGRAGAGVVRDTGFAEQAAAPRRHEPPRASGAGPVDTEVEILTKPKPLYTDEARGLKLEGDVVLDVVFEASGALRVLGVAQGLGHGLDEAAIAAAKKIQFTPARRDGIKVDQAAKLRVVFRLA